MQTRDIAELAADQRRFFASGATRPLHYRLTQLRRLKSVMKERERELLDALKADLGKSEFEAYTSEIGFVYEEISHVLRSLSGWMRPRSVPTPLLLQPAVSRIYSQPKGPVLIIGPWNYPLQLVLAPLVGALAAGNCVVLKPSELAQATSRAIANLIANAFPAELCAVVGGGVPETTELLKEAWGHIFFTGSIPVGRVVMRAAAETLTPVTLELGGKSPCIVDETIDLEVTARRIVWGKFFNAGQTCVAPDYLLVPGGIKDRLVAAMQVQVREFFGPDPAKSPDYGRIVNDRHFERIRNLISGRVIIGGQNDRSSRYVAPTLIDDVRISDKIMEDEIFGPILPIMAYNRLDDAFDVIKARPNPLACYVFTNSKTTERRVIEEVPFGGGCVNNALVHLANPHLPFGGIGNSGVGAYHGKHSFETFSHRKAVVKSPTFLDIKLKYPPYRGLVLIRRLLK